METVASRRGSNGPEAQDSRADSDGFEAPVRRQLLAELNSALAFADYCRYIGQDQVSSRAEELVSVAQSLYEDTLSAIRRSAMPRTAGARTNDRGPARD